MFSPEARQSLGARAWMPRLWGEGSRLLLRFKRLLYFATGARWEVKQGVASSTKPCQAILQIDIIYLSEKVYAWISPRG